MAWLDIDRIPELMKVSRLTSYNRWNWASFDERDHLGNPRLPLRQRLERSALEAGVAPPEGPVFLLTHLRYAGYCFNPVSFFYAFDGDGRLKKVAAAVTNTFGGSHVYWLAPDGDSPTFRSAATKSLYVSPFMPAELVYRFALTPPGDRLVVHMTVDSPETTLLDATLSLERRPWSAREIRRHLARYPLMTAKVMSAIHWEALKLWWKGVPITVQPEA